ncbi:MAG TPA: hypothetical protein VMN60_03435, partial [Longimicrobiales bacterium]|nr:hypothetical protein [Longimicrobiales bacterium]
TVRTTVIVVATFIVLLVFGTILVGYVNDVTTLDLFSPIDVLNDLFVTWAGPFHVFGGAWVLIDV